MNILFQDEHFVAIDKPAGFHVHPHEDPRNRVERDRICLYLVRDMVGQHVYPVHRLDAGTCGVLLFALSSDSARVLSRLFAEKTLLKKTYMAVARGYVPAEDMISIPLELDSTGDAVESHTRFRRLKTVEFPVAVGNRFPTARYSLVEAQPLTGRFHQIRRHFCRISHPLLGDSTHGDSRHNQFFRNKLGIEGLCLKAESLEFKHPWTDEELRITAPDSEKWKKIHLLFDSPPSL